MFIALLLQPFEFDPDATRHELNVYLQTDLMVIHPPIVFSFYALCLLVGSISLEGMINGSEHYSIHEEQLPAARAAFFAGTVGIGGVIGLLLVAMYSPMLNMGSAMGGM